MQTESQDITDAELLKRSARGDEEAFYILYKRHRDSIYRFLYGMVGESEKAEDITHDCFLALIKHPERYDPSRASLRTYLFTAARNLALNSFRKRGKESTLDEVMEDQYGSDEQVPLRNLLEGELSSAVSKAIASLPPAQREVLIPYVYDDLSLAEVATICGTDVGVVKSRLHRAREQLRKLFAPYFNVAKEKQQ